jgi:trehalose 6-phosphate phosphatase
MVEWAMNETVLPRSLDGWAFFLDIDGTLIEIAPAPDAVVVPPGLPGLLDRLCAGTGGAMALLTGRDIATVDRLFAPARLPVGAVHGAHLRDASGRIIGDPPDPALAAVRERLAAFVAAHPPAILEDKGIAVAVHFRADPGLEPEAEAVVREAVSAAGGSLVVQPGKMVFEVRPAGADKGAALAAFMRGPAFAGRRPVAVGDDLTDESMFAAAKAHGGLALRVGAAADPRSSAVTAFAAPADVRQWLSGMIAG